MTPFGAAPAYRSRPGNDERPRADVVSIHVPLTPATRHLIGPGRVRENEARCEREITAGRPNAGGFTGDFSDSPDAKPRRQLSFRRLGHPGLGQDRLEEFDGVAGGIFDDDLLAACSGDDVVAEPGAAAAQFRDGG